MAVARSFSDYVKSKCYNGLFDAAKEYFDEHWDEMDLHSSRVRHITAAVIIDATIQRVYVTDRPGDGIAFDVGLELEIAVSAADHHTDSDDTCYQWLRISCEGDLAIGLDDWRVTNIGVYQKRSSLPQNSMSDALVPDIRYEQLEDVAARFLEEHFKEALQIPRAGQAPVYVDPLVLAERLGLSVRTGHIREDASIFGQIFFADADTEMYDPQQEKMVPVHVDAKTIVADPEVFLLRNLGALNNTIIHECVHWDKHRKVFLLEKLYNAAASGISCEVVCGAKAEMARQATEKMEQQANWLTPRIQMPAAPFKARATELIAKFMRETHAAHEIDVMEMVIEQLVVDYQVSKQAAKIRLVELGIESAVGTFTSVDGHYVRPHSYTKGAIQRNQTFTIGDQDAIIQRMVNPALRSLTGDGDYLYVENHFVYNAPLYVERDIGGHLQLTDYARSHMDECCLVFDMAIKGPIKDVYHTICFLNREPGAYSFELTYHEGFENAPQERQIAMRKADREEEIGILKQMTGDPEQCLNLLLGWRKTDRTELGAAIGRDPKTISRTVKMTTDPQLDTVVLICLGLNLPPSISTKFMDTLGCKFNLVNERHLWISETIATQWMKPIEDNLEHLAQYGVTF